MTSSLASLSQNKKIDSLKTILKQEISTEEKAETYILLIDQFFSLQKDSAEIYLNKTIKLTENIESLKRTNILALLKYAQFYIIKGDYTKSQEYYTKVNQKLRDFKNYDLETKYFGDFGVLNFYQGDFKGALTNFDKALQLAESNKNEEDQLRFLNNKALAMSYLGKAEASLDIHKKAISLAEKLNDSTALGKSFNNIGLIYEDMKEYRKALEFYLKSLKIKENSSSQVDVANSLFNVAGMYKEIGEEEKDTSLYVNAENYYQKSLDVAKKINYGKIILFNKTGMAQLATVRKKPKKAIEIYKSVINEAQKTKDLQTLRVTYLNLGVNYIRTKKIASAEQNLLLAKPMIEKANNPSDLAKLYKNLSVLYQEKKQYKKAFEYLLKQKEFEDELSKNSLKDKISDFEVKYETTKKEKEIAQQKEELLTQKLAIKNRNLYAILLTAALLILGIIFFAVYKRNLFKKKQLQKEIDLKDALATIKTQNRLQEQRLRISRDLHDNIGSQLTFIISSIDNLKFISKDASEKLKDKLSNISSFTGDTIHQLRDTIWAMNKSEITVEDLHTRILSFVEKAKNAVPNTKFDIEYTIDKNENFTSLAGMNIFRVIQEAINNSIKYAEADTIKIELNKKEQLFIANVIDNGKGFSLNSTELGNGLSNMEKRMSEIEGSVKIISKETKGTTITLEVPLKNKANDV
ncbi:tetratricopeptide repeat protein [Polaribacter porphyrae]|uniref:histidine kinase n=1 Tax=Polaribacter porphyrae TaxID=1137780 RepID=A0A2S7WPW4_9FLAO|nr:tetratricopeptide repeat protein [Polaribacter porphyrae]PQJ79623.1 hypothetical protein BTO18_10760 [Polaribacter porphyrae]